MLLGSCLSSHICFECLVYAVYVTITFSQRREMAKKALINLLCSFTGKYWEFLVLEVHTRSWIHAKKKKVNCRLERTALLHKYGLRSRSLYSCVAPCPSEISWLLLLSCENLDFFPTQYVTLPPVGGKNTEKVADIKIEHILLSHRCEQTGSGLFSMDVKMFPSSRWEANPEKLPDL